MYRNVYLYRMVSRGTVETCMYRTCRCCEEIQKIQEFKVGDVPVSRDMRETGQGHTTQPTTNAYETVRNFGRSAPEKQPAPCSSKNTFRTLICGTG